MNILQQSDRIRSFVKQNYSMPDKLTPAQRHRNMAAIHSASTKPELLLRKSLWRLGFRYLVNDKRLPGKPDIVLPKYRTAIFVHGCFWHGHKDCKKYVIPKTHTDFWIAKIARNKQRDQETWRQLEAKGWNVIVVWECELTKNLLSDTVTRVSNTIKENGRIYSLSIDARRKSREMYRFERASKKKREVQLLAEIKSVNSSLTQLSKRK